MGKTYTDFSQLSKGMFKKSAPVEEIKPLPKTKAVGGDDADALKRLDEFLSQEFGFSLADNPAALRRDAETIPNTIAPYHLVLNVTVPFDFRKVV